MGKTLGFVIIASIIVVLALPLLTVLKNGVPLFDSPGLSARLGKYLSDNHWQTSTGSPFPELRPMRIAMPKEQAQARLQQRLQALPWRCDLQPDGRQHCVIASALLGFKDDLFIELRPAPDGNTELWLDSRSRLGKADFGQNCAHILRLQAGLNDANRPASATPAK